MTTSDTALEIVLGYSFARRELLMEALTHSTYANEHPDSGPNNQRLEFVGDAVLGLLASRMLYECLPKAGEGELSRRRAAVVCTQSFACMARELDIAAYMRFGHGQDLTTGRAESTLADAYEALAGALFFDGGYAAVERCLGPRLSGAIAATVSVTDYKTRLQEQCHARGLAVPCYTVVSTSGPDHARVYSCQVRVGDSVLGCGEGTSKKAAEQSCAAQALAAWGTHDREE